MACIKGHAPLTSDWINQASFGHINTVTFSSQYKPWMKCTWHHSVIELTSRRFFIMDATDYWPFAREYSIWNTAVAAFEWELTLEDGAYESGWESWSIPIPLCWAPQLYHVSTHENLSFGPATPRAHSSQQPGTLTTVHHHLMFEEDDESSLDRDTPKTWMGHHSPDKHTMACHLTSVEEEDKDE